MISGVTGEEFKADIFIGLVYYQRLRHMVSDKFQVWLAGPSQMPAHADACASCVIKGRKRFPRLHLWCLQKAWVSCAPLAPQLALCCLRSASKHSVLKVYPLAIMQCLGHAVCPPCNGF